MKYREGDLVRIKSKTWWNDQPKNESGEVYIHENDWGFLEAVFPETMANSCCGGVLEIEVVCSGKYHYVTTNNWWFREEWIEKKIENWKIKLKLMKRDL